ncbi:MAG: cob(I)yrinic acid a,c-diamide adenosyltransferase [Patescibacteria group bacterium]
MLYTRKGDDGTSGLFGTRERFAKDSPVYEALGTLDELNSLLGICRAKSADGGFGVLAEEIRKAQEALFVIQAEIAGAEKTIRQERIAALESAVDIIERFVGNPHSFIVPGATELSGFLDYARAVSRRAERAVTAASRIRPVSSESHAFMNRLSSLLYALARYAASGVVENVPAY